MPQKSKRKSITFQAATSVASDEPTATAASTEPPSFRPTSKPQLSVTIQNIYNEEGQDVTPRPLQLIDPLSIYETSRRKTLRPLSTVLTEDHDDMSVISVTGSHFSELGLQNRTVFTVRSLHGISFDINRDDVLDSTQVASGKKTRSSSGAHPVHLTEKELDADVYRKLSMSKMYMFLNVPDIRVSSTSSEAAEVAERNEVYAELCRNREGNDRYVERTTNTFNEQCVSKLVGTELHKFEDKAAYATVSDIYDSYEALKRRSVRGTLTDTDISEEESVTPALKLDQWESSFPQLELDALKTCLRAVERVLCVNAYHQPLALYRGLQPMLDPFVTEVKDNEPEQEADMSEASGGSIFLGFESSSRLEMEETSAEAAAGSVPSVASKTAGAGSSFASARIDTEPKIELLWSFQCPLSVAYNVTAIDWNKTNQDLLAVGYALFSYNTPDAGLVCCWSLKNITYPERHYTLDVGVTSVAFSICRPNLLAVGLLDGVIAVYNVSSDETHPHYDTIHVDGRHVGPVWGLEWVAKERSELYSSTGHEEMLVSVSGDGHVVQWTIRKEFKGNTIQKLRSPPAKLTSEINVKPGDTPVQEYACGLAVSFCRDDKNMYLVGTEDGYIHRCLCTHTEQYLCSYKGHMGPVYAVQWSPFNSNVFLSSSTDWDVKIWHQDWSYAAFSLTSPLKSAYDACWSPFVETLLASCNEDALYIWDISRNSLDPVIVQPSQSAEAKLMCCQFAFNASAVLTGDEDGCVTVYGLHGFEQHPDDQGQLLETLMQAALSNKTE